MASPIILGFDPGSSLSSLDSIVVGAGVSWGTITLPMVPLLFNQERIAAALGPNNGYATGRASLDNQGFYNNTYSGLPLTYKHQFWGPPTTIQKRVSGVAIGLSGGAIMSAASSAIKSVLNRIVGGIVTSVGLDALQSSTSLDALLYGMNGRGTYDENVPVFSSRTNIFFINMGIGCVTQGALNIVFIGDFPSTHDYSNPLAFVGHLWSVYQNSKAYAFVADAAVGFIMPGASVAFMST
jgi:hypothetical protein